MHPQFVHNIHRQYETELSNLLGNKATDHINTMLSYWDWNGICRFANNAYLKRFDVSRERLVNVLTKREFHGEEDYKKMAPFITKVLKGEKQIYQRKETVYTSKISYSIITYYPDFVDTEVVGFFAQVFDIKPIKELNPKFRAMEKVKERELMRSVIEAQEVENELIAYQLKESVNQTLAYCKIMLEKAGGQQNGKSFLKNFSTHIHQTIDELNALSTKMSPSLIKMLGFIAGVKEYITVFEQRHNIEVIFECGDEGIEQIENTNKIALFRIIQDYLLLFADSVSCNTISVEVNYYNPTVKLKLVNNDASFEMSKQCNSYTNIMNRVECYGGRITEAAQQKEVMVEIELQNIN